jgi:Mg2+-importing ATPase
MQQPPAAFWSVSVTEMLQNLETAKEGWTGAEARQRLTRYGSNLLKPKQRSDVFTLLLVQFMSLLFLPLSRFLKSVISASLIVLVIRVRNLSSGADPRNFWS